MSALTQGAPGLGLLGPLEAELGHTTVPARQTQGYIPGAHPPCPVPTKREESNIHKGFIVGPLPVLALEPFVPVTRPKVHLPTCLGPVEREGRN